MSNENSTPESSNVAVNKAVAELLTNLTGQECFKGLNDLFAGYLRSDFSNNKKDRMLCTYAYECFRDFTLSLKAMEEGSRKEFLSNLKNQES